jgi:DNA polymerase-3 subunit beta
MPILAGVRIAATPDLGGQLHLAAFDYELSANVSASAEVPTPGEVLVNGKLLTDIAKLLPAKPVDVQLEGAKVVITCGSSTFQLPSMPLDDYPQLPQMPSIAGTIKAGALAAAVSQVATAATNDETLPKLTGVMFEFNGDHLTLLATDRYRLAIRELEWTPTKPDFEAKALVRARTLRDLVKTFGHDDDVSIHLSPTGEIIGFEDAGRQTTTLLIEGDYPAIRKLLPTETQIEAVVPVAAFSEAVRRVSLVADRNTSIQVSFTEGQAVLKAGSADEAAATEVVEAKLNGSDEIDVAFNPAYLAEGLSVLGSAYVRLAMTHPTKPVLFKGQVEIDAEPDTSFQYLLVPIRFV